MFASDENGLHRVAFRYSSMTFRSGEYAKCFHVRSFDTTQAGREVPSTFSMPCALRVRPMVVTHDTHECQREAREKKKRWVTVPAVTVE